MTPPADGHRARNLFVAVACPVAAVLPPFLLGSLSSLVRADLHFDEAQLGFAVGSFYGVSAVTAIPGGRLAERLGAPRSLSVGLFLTICALAGIAVVADTWAQIVPFLALAGGANGFIQTAASLAIVRGVRQGRLGVALAVKQSAVPTATLLAGLSVPLLGLTVGWRWAFGLAAVAAGSLLIPATRNASGHPATARRRERVRFGPSERRGLLVMATATGCGAFAGNSIAAFYVESSVSAGHSLAIAGLLLSAGSLAGIAVRLVLGWWADRTRFEPLTVVATMLLFGTGGFLVIGYARGAGLHIMGTIIAFAAGWGWTGLMQLAIARRYAAAPAAAAGIVHAGGLTGGLLGPIVFGQAASSTGYHLAWTVVAGVALCGGGLLLLERHLQTQKTGSAVAQQDSR